MFLLLAAIVGFAVTALLETRFVVRHHPVKAVQPQRPLGHMTPYNGRGR